MDYCSSQTCGSNFVSSFLYSRAIGRTENEGKGDFKGLEVRSRGLDEAGGANRYYEGTELHATITIMSVCELVRLLACGSEY
jgi:hypothetical protein